MCWGRIKLFDSFVVFGCCFFLLFFVVVVVDVIILRLFLFDDLFDGVIGVLKYNDFFIKRKYKSKSVILKVSLI